MHTIFCWGTAAGSNKSALGILHCETPPLKNRGDATGDFKRGVGIP
jgi:hypothetical protein